MTNCCKKEKIACKDFSTKKKKTGNTCNQSGCTMLFGCDQCGFIVKDIFNLAPVPDHLQSKPVAPYNIGNIVGYYAYNWKPPKAC